MVQYRFRRFAAVSCIAISAVIGSAAQADEVEGTDADIVVTATRREERAVDVPIAVTSFGGEKLDTLNSSGLDVRFLSSRVPSLQIESSFGRTFPRFYIRGLGNTDFDPNSAQPVSVVYDDVALESPMLKSFPAFDLASVEVLRGPQGTLFGRNTPAGVVKFNSTRPGDTLSGKVSISGATYNTVNAEAAVGGPLGGGFGFRLAGLVQRRDDWVTNTASGPGVLADRKFEGYNDRAARLLLSYEGGPFEALFNVHGRKLDGTPRIFRAGLFQKGSNHFNAGFDKDTVGLDGLTSQTLSQWGTNLHLSLKLEGLGTLYSVSAYEKARVESSGDIDGASCYAFIPGCSLPAINVAAFPVNTGGVTRPREISQELRFASEDMGGFTWQVGAYYFRQKLGYNELAFDGSGATVSHVIHSNRNRNYGLFASGEYKVTPDFTLSGGVRYSNDKKRDFIGGVGQFPGVVLPVTNRVSGDNVSWDLSATYTVAPNLNVYARFATGYLGPAIQDRVNFGSVPSTAGKQTTISGEAGIKGALAGELNFALDGYWYRTKDLQLTAVGGATNSARLLSADKAVGYGLEAELSAKPFAGLAITLGGSYNHTEIKDPTLVVGACGGGCTMLDPIVTIGGNTGASIDGNPLPQAPKWVANATLRYGIPVGDDEIFVFTDWAYRSSINYFLYEAAEFRGRALLEGGARVGYKTSDGLEVAIFARNITNTIRSISAIDFNNLTGMINEPRIVGGELRFSF